jgi:hypothetical protein
MIIVAGLVAVVASVLLLGGHISRLAEIRLRHPELVVIALVLQTVVISFIPDSLPLAASAGIHLLTYAIGAAFVWLNRRIPGLWIIALGAGANLAAIAANGGEMPASRWAVATSGLPTVTKGFKNSGAIAHARLAPLGDIFAVPRGWPLANVFSIGDVVLLIGAAVLLHGVCQSRIGRRFAPPGTEPADSDAGSGLIHQVRPETVSASSV